MEVKIMLPEDNEKEKVSHLKKYLDTAAIKGLTEIKVERSINNPDKSWSGNFINSLNTFIDASTAPLIELIRCLQKYVNNYRTEITISTKNGGKIILSHGRAMEADELKELVIAIQKNLDTDFKEATILPPPNEATTQKGDYFSTTNEEIVINKSVLSETKVVEKSFKYLEQLEQLSLSIEHPVKSNLQTEIEDDIKSEIKKLKEGFLFFECPQQMTLGKQETVIAEIFKDKKLLNTITDRKKLNDIKVGKRMSVKLLGKDFEIFSKNNESQVILPDEKTTWEWDITPKKHGQKKLELVVTVRLKLEGKDELYDFPILEKEILIKINRIYIASNFLEKNWQWIISTIVGSGVLIVILKALGVIPK